MAAFEKNGKEQYLDLVKKLSRLFRRPLLFTAFRKIDPLFREQILITVSIANTCGG